MDSGDARIPCKIRLEGPEMFTKELFVGHSTSNSLSFNHRYMYFTMFTNILIYTIYNVHKYIYIHYLQCSLFLHDGFLAHFAALRERQRTAVIYP